jgi:hypothetical protein
METNKKCPHCAEIVQIEAKKCRHCGEWLDKDAMLSHEKEINTARNEIVSQVRPWVRYFARFIDYIIIGFLFGFTIAAIAPDFTYRTNSSILGLIAIGIWIFIESALLSTWGTTPGKWLFKTEVRLVNGNKLSFNDAIGRSLDVWVRGVAFGLPLISLITMIIGYQTLTKNKVANWDKERGFMVRHQRISSLRAIIITLILLATISLIAYGNSL